MGPGRSEPENDAIVAAIEHVLEAERAAEAEVARCRQRAQAVTAAARDRAAAIAARTDARISELHAAYLRKVDAEIIAQTPGPDAAGRTDDDGEGALRKAAARLAAKLTGGERELPL